MLSSTPSFFTPFSRYLHAPCTLTLTFKLDIISASPLPHPCTLDLSTLDLSTLGHTATSPPLTAPCTSMLTLDLRLTSDPALRADDPHDHITPSMTPATVPHHFITPITPPRRPP